MISLKNGRSYHRETLTIDEQYNLRLWRSIRR